MGTWRCGDCGREIPKSEDSCGRYLDDYLSLRGGSIESAITRAVEEAIAPLVKASENRLRGIRTWHSSNYYVWSWRS